MSILKIVCHNKNTIKIGRELGWLPGARYTNLRDIRDFDKVGLIDIDWKNYDFQKHLRAVQEFQPILTIAKDIECIDELNQILKQAEVLQKYCTYVVIVPKDIRLIQMTVQILQHFLFGYSVPTRHGKTTLPLSFFDRPVHFLGGHPQLQREIATSVDVFSMDCNRFTLDAKLGDFFNGNKFIPHPEGYQRCIRDSIHNINRIWSDYKLERKL
ncbi:DUF6610 family protein [Legionella sp. CNM-1927-20]|uniref:DUF6610 family protein n=1 Tax=Legionella sp. CNM-1927-20 TaxID=3422221 RepID=UPI00403B252E